MIKIGTIHDPEEATLIVVVLDEETGDTIEFQRKLHPDSKDIALGHDRVCVCAYGGPVVYGGVRAWYLSQTELVVRLDNDAAATLSVPPNFASRL